MIHFWRMSRATSTSPAWWPVRLVKALGALRVGTTDELQREVSRLYEAYDTWAKSLSKQYDDETNHGRNVKVQAEWEARIQTVCSKGQVSELRQAEKV